MPLVKCVIAPKPNSLREGETLEVGKQYEMSEDSVNRWLRRGVVEVVEVKPSKKAEPKETKDEPATDSSAGGQSGNAGRGKGASAG